MKRIIIAIVAVALAVSIAFVGFFIVKYNCEKLTDKLEVVCKTARDDDDKAAVKESEKAVKLWESVHDLIESFIRHEETDKLEEIVKSLPVYARQGNMERLEQQANLAIDEIEHLLRNEKPLISNIL